MPLEDLEEPLKMPLEDLEEPLKRPFGRPLRALEKAFGRPLRAFQGHIKARWGTKKKVLSGSADGCVS